MFYRCMKCESLLIREEPLTDANKIHDPQPKVLTVSGGAANSAVKLVQCTGQLQPVFSANHIILEGFEVELTNALRSTQSNWESVQKDFEILLNIDKEKHAAIESILNNIYQVIITATQMGLSLIPGVGSAIGASTAAILKGIVAGEPLYALTGAARLGANITESFGELPYLNQNDIKTGAKQAGNLLENAQDSMARFSVEEPTAFAQTGTAPRPSVARDLEHNLAAVALYLEKIEKLNKAFQNGVLFGPLIFAYGLTPKLETPARPYFQQAELSTEEIQKIVQPGQNLTLKLTFPEESSPSETFKNSQCYTKDQLLKIRLYKTGFVKYLGQQTGLFKASTKMPVMGRTVSLHSQTNGPGTALRALLYKIKASYREQQTVRPLVHESQDPFARLLNSMKIEEYSNLRHAIQWWFGHHNIFNKLPALFDPDAAVSFYEMYRIEMILSWLVIYKIFELHLGTPIPGLVPFNAITNYKMQNAFCDIVDLAGRILYFKKTPPGTKEPKNLLIDSLFALPGIFEYYIGGLKSEESKIIIQAPLKPSAVRDPDLNSPIEKIIMRTLQRKEKKLINRANITTQQNYFVYQDNLLCVENNYTNFNSNSANSHAYEGSATAIIIDNINNKIKSFLITPQPLSGAASSEHNTPLLQKLKATVPSAYFSESGHMLISRFAQSDKKSDLLHLLEHILSRLSNFDHKE